MTSTIKVDTIQDSGGNTIISSDGSGTITQTASIGSFSSTGIDDNASSTAITIDSSQRVGIGTASPSSPLHIKTTGGVNAQLNLEASSFTPVIRMYSGGASIVPAINYGAGSGDSGFRFLQITTGAGIDGGTTERMRIDSSGNLLVGKTSLDYDSTAGHILRGDGLINSTRSGGNVTDFNRLSSEGEVVRISKDGTTVGNIGVANDNLEIESAGDRTGLAFRQFGEITPKRNGSLADNTVDLGSTSYRFRDIRLSGGVYLGGTGSDNYLDDYEEGTFTPTYAASGGAGEQPTVSYGTQVGRYTKIGRLVTIFVAFNTNSASNLGGTSAYRLRIAGLPFTLNSSGRGGSGISQITNWADAQNGIAIQHSSGTVLTLKNIEGGNSSTDLFTNDLRTTSDSNQMAFSYQYETD